MTRTLIGLISLSFYLSTAIVFAQITGSIAGRVLIADDRVPSGISVKLEESGQTITTDVAGRFSFGNLAPGKYKLMISGGGFMPQTREVEINVGQAVREDVRLEKITASIDVVASLKEYHLEESNVGTRVNARLIDVPQSMQVFPQQFPVWKYAQPV
jgi:hypothetical protein